MLTPDVKVRGFTAEEWIGLGDLLRPKRATEASAPARSGGVVAVTTGSKLRKLVSTEHGRLDPLAEFWPDELPKLAERHRARWAVEMCAGALDELMNRFADRLHQEQDVLAQTLEFIAALRELEAEGAISVWPWKLAQWPVPNDRVLMTAFDTLCPDGKALVVGVFESGDLSTCLAARRRGRGIDLIVGPGELREQMGLLSGDWTRDYRHLARAAERELGPLAVGCFAETATFRRLLERQKPGAWAAAVAARDIILSPLLPALTVPLGLDVGRAAVATMRHLAEKIGVGSWLTAEGPLGVAFGRVQQLAPSERELRETLGFDPLALLRKLFISETDDR